MTQPRTQQLLGFSSVELSPSGAFRSLRCLIYKVHASSAEHCYYTALFKICQQLFSNFLFFSFRVFRRKADRISDPLVLALPIFPGRRQPSIVGRNELNYRVRNGNGWTLILINTNYLILKKEFGDPYRIRTDVNGVRGRCLNHLTNGPLVHLQGLEPGTH